MKDYKLSEIKEVCEKQDTCTGCEFEFSVCNEEVGPYTWEFKNES